ncbi:MAG: multiheme c-type cytochrome [Desulfatiglandaceae bacterium]
MAQQLKKLGFTNVCVIAGGYNDWVKLKLPLEKKWNIKKECVTCHESVTPGIVSDWRLSKHSKNEVTCSVCHGDYHSSDEDIEKARPVTPDRCILCHQVQGDQFKAGKHAQAWRAMKALPAAHWKSMSSLEGLKDCESCHRIGIKSTRDMRELLKKSAGFGMASCDVCHTRHTFFKKEAQQPQACQTCHNGGDHPQWEMYSGSKHGVRQGLKQMGILPQSTSAPTCQTCHMEKGNHEVQTAWGFLAVRLEMNGDKEWVAASKTILQALRLVDPDGKPTPRMTVMKRIEVFRQTDAGWKEERKKMLVTCTQCHSVTFAEGELKKGDRMIRKTDLLMAEAIRAVASLYEDGILERPKGYAQPFPDFMAPLKGPKSIELKLWRMFGEYRMLAFQGVFHANPSYAFWHGLGQMEQTLSEIKEMAVQLRKNASNDAGTG